MHINRIVEECSCNNCNDRELHVGYKIYFGVTNITTTITLCRPCLDNMGFMIGTAQQRTSLYQDVTASEIGKFVSGDEGSEHKD